MVLSCHRLALLTAADELSAVMEHLRAYFDLLAPDRPVLLETTNSHVAILLHMEEQH